MNGFSFMEIVSELMVCLDIHKYLKLLTKQSYQALERYFELVKVHTQKSEKANQKISYLVQ